MDLSMLLLRYNRARIWNQVSFAINNNSSIFHVCILYCIIAYSLLWWSCDVNEICRAMWFDMLKYLENTYKKLPTSSCANDDQLWCYFLLIRSYWSTLLQTNVQNKSSMGKDSFGTIYSSFLYPWILSYFTSKLLIDWFPLLLPVVWGLFN